MRHNSPRVGLLVALVFAIGLAFALVRVVVLFLSS